MNHSETIQALKLKFVERHAAPYLPNSQAPENNGEDSVDGFSVQGDRIPAKVRISRLGLASFDYHPKVEGYSRFWGHCPRHRTGSRAFSVLGHQ